MGGNWGVQRRIRSDIQSIQTLPLFPGPPCHPRSTSVEDIYQASLWSRTCFIQPQSHPAPWNRVWCIKSPFHDSDNNNWNCNKSWIWCIMCSIIFPLDTAKNKKKPGALADLLIRVQLNTRRMHTPPWKLRAAYLCSGREDISARLSVSVWLQYKALIQTLWFGGWEDVRSAPVRGLSLPRTTKKSVL